MKSILKFLLTLVFCLILVHAVAAENVLIIPEDVTVIEEEAFAGDVSLGEVVLPEGLLEIRDRAFSGSSLTKINLPASLESIADDALDQDGDIEVTAIEGTAAYRWAVRRGFIDSAGDWAHPTLQAQVSGNLVTLTLEADEAADSYVIYELKGENYSWIKSLNEPGQTELYGVAAGEHVYAVQASKFGPYLEGDYILADAVSVAEYEPVDCGFYELSTKQYGRSSANFFFYSYAYQEGAADGYRILDYDGNMLCELPYTRTGSTYRVDGLKAGHYNLRVCAWKDSGNGERIYSRPTSQGKELTIVQNDSDFVYEETTDGIRITGYLGDGNGLHIPSVIDGLPVVTIGSSAFEDYRGENQQPLIQGSLSLPDTLQSIEFDAFSSCSGLTGKLTLPASLTKLDSYAFSGCLGFTGQILLPEGLKSLGIGVFRYCSGFSGELRIPSGIRTIDGALITGTGISSVWLSQTVETASFYQCPQLNTVTVLSNETSLFFQECEAMGTIICKRDSRAWEMGSERGYTLQELAIEVPEELIYTNLDASTCEVAGYTAVLPQTLTIPEQSPEGKTVVGIANHAFEGCGYPFSTGGTIVLPETIVRIGEYAFADCKASYIDLPQSVRELGAHVFDGAYSLRRIVVPEGVTVIPDYAFADCQNVQELEIPEGVVSIGVYALSGGTLNSTTEFTLPSTIRIIGDYAIFYNINLETVNLNEGLEEIGTCTFTSCPNLKKLQLPESLVRLKEGAFRYSALTEINIPSKLSVIPAYAFSQSGLTEIVVPGTVKEIGESAFSHCYDLKTAVVEEGVLTLADKVFENSYNLEELMLPGSVESIGEKGFGWKSDVIIKCPEDSAAWEWALDNGFSPQAK